MKKTAEIIRQGGIVAVKGLGGFHLMADARNSDAVPALRRRKRREGKALAVMFPSLDSVKSLCAVSALEERLLVSPESPIVLLKRERVENLVSEAVAPRNPTLARTAALNLNYGIGMENLSLLATRH